MLGGSKQLDDLTILKLVEIAVELADRGEFGGLEHRHDLDALAAELAGGVGRDHRHREDQPPSAALLEGRQRRAHRGSGGDPVIDHHRCMPLDVAAGLRRNRAFAGIRFRKARDHARARYKPDRHGRAPATLRYGRCEMCSVDDSRDGIFRVGRQADLPDEQHVGRSIDHRGEFDGDGHSPARQGQHHGLGDLQAYSGRS